MTSLKSECTYPNLIACIHYIALSCPITEFNTFYFYFLKCIYYLFILAALGLCCGTLAVERLGSVVAARGLSCGTWDLSSLTTDRTRAPCTGSVASQPLCHQEAPLFSKSR